MRPTLARYSFVLGAAILIAVLFAVYHRSPSTTPSAPALSMEAREQGPDASPTALVLAEDQDRDPTPIAVAPLTEQFAPSANFETKYADYNAEKLLAARNELVSKRARLVDSLLKQKLDRGEYELVSLKAGEEFSPALPPGWAIGHLGVGTEDGSQELRVVRLDVPNHPETASLYAEAQWLGGRIDALGARPKGVLQAR